MSYRTHQRRRSCIGRLALFFMCMLETDARTQQVAGIEGLRNVRYNTNNLNHLRYLGANGGSNTDDGEPMIMKKTKPPKVEKKEKISKMEIAPKDKGGMTSMMMGKGGKGDVEEGNNSSGMMMRGNKDGGMMGGKGGMMAHKTPSVSPSPIVSKVPTIKTTSPSPAITPIDTTTGAPTVAPLPKAMTSVPTTLSPMERETQPPSTSVPAVTSTPVSTSPTSQPTPSNQPIAIAPTDFIFVGSGNIVVRYNSIIDNTTAVPRSITYNDTLEVIDLTCDYIRTEGVLRPFMGEAIEFLCIWFLPPDYETTPQMFPIDIIYAGTAAFSNNATNINMEALDTSIIESLSEPYVTNLTTIVQTQLPSNNSFINVDSIIVLV